MNFSGWLSWRLWVFSALVLVAGMAVGALVSAWLYVNNLTVLAEDLSRKDSRIQLLEILAQQQLPATGQRPLDAATSPSIETAALQQTSPHQLQPAAGGKSTVPAARQMAQRATSTAQPPGKAAAPVAAVKHVATVAAAPAPSVAPHKDSMSPQARQEAPPVASPESARPVSGDELFQALRFKIEGVSAEKAGVVKVERNAVHLKNGTVIRPGEVFPSGERLLSVDHENERVVTSQRQMLLFFGR